MKPFLFSVLLLSFIATDAFAQLYPVQNRVPDQNWQELRTERFRVIYPERYLHLAEQTLRILELEYADIQLLVGGELLHFPVILNPENDLSNGFVSPFNFRSEIELSPIKGKVLSPRSGSWLESVVPHELVHALHFNNYRGGLLHAPLRLFSPDASRSIHAAAPLGVLEGVAVEHESHNTMPQSGRGNHPFFYNQFNSMAFDDQWSMGRLVHVTSYTPPFNRHYVGGYEFVNWLQNTHGENTMREAIEFHHKYPFLGFGFALRRVTGYYPARLWRDFDRHHQEKEEERLAHFDPSTDQLSDKIPINATCINTSRPVWLDDDRILYYGRFCNQKTGFYIHHLTSGDTDLLHEVSIVEDRSYGFSPDSSALIYSRYHTDPIYDNLFRSDLHRLDLSTGKSTRLTKNKRISSPRYSGDQLYALQTVGQRLQLVVVEDGEVSQSFPMRGNSRVVDFDFHPENPNKVAILGRVAGVQAIWIDDISRTDSLFTHNPDIVFGNGSLYDPVWHSSGEKLLFTSDYTGVMNTYEYHHAKEKITQITDSRFNAFEASYSPNSSAIAYIKQQGNEQFPSILDSESMVRRELEPSAWQSNHRVESMMNRPLLNREDLEVAEWEQLEYSTGASWLVPRTWVPTLESNRVNRIDQFGIRAESADVMSRNSYTLEASVFNNRLWHDVTYRYRGFYPGMNVRAFSNPSLTALQYTVNDQNRIAQFTLQQRGLSIEFPFLIRLNQNTRFSSLFIRPEYSLSQLKFRGFNDARETFSEFSTPRHTLGLTTNFNFGLRQFTRDMQPNSGISFFTQSRIGLNDSEFIVNVPDGELTGPLSKRRGFRAGSSVYISPLRKFNQSLRISAEAVTQTDLPVFDTQSLFSDHFNEPQLFATNNIGIIGTRYTIPLTYPDDGGLLLPVYLSNIYLVLFSQTVGDIGGFDSERFSNSARSVVGGGIRSRFRLGNLLFDMGISVGWQPATNEVNYVFSAF